MTPCCCLSWTSLPWSDDLSWVLVPCWILHTDSVSISIQKHPRTFMKIHPLHWCTACTLQLINLQARRTSVVPQDHKETLRNKPNNFQKALEQLKKSWHTSTSGCSNDKRPCEANLEGEKEENNRSTTVSVSHSLGEKKHKKWANNNCFTWL